MAALPLDFRRFGRGFHPIIESASDLARVPELPDAHWVATAAPINALRADLGMLSALDSDGDGRIRSDELRTAIRWLLATLKDTGGINAGKDVLDLSAVATDTDDGAAIVAAAKRMLSDRGEGDAKSISLATVREVVAEEEARGLSAAGRVRTTAAGDDVQLTAFLEHVIAVTGGEPHPLGDAAVTEATLSRFLDEGAAWLDWYDKGQLPAGQDTSEILPLGDKTAAAAAALEAVQGKLEQYFLLCDAVALDPALAEHAWVDAKETDLLDPDAAAALLERAPIARPSADGVLDLDGTLNPAWRGPLQTLASAAAVPLLGEEQGKKLTRSGWESLQARLAPFQAWRDAEPQTSAGADGADKLRAELADPTLAERTRSLLEQSEVAAAVLAGVKLVERVLLYQAGMLKLVNSFVAMPDLYEDGKRALYEHGTLILDGRVFDLAVRVYDAGRAGTFAGRSPLFIMFVQTGEKGGKLDKEYMVPITAGERGNVVEGMWGVFYDLAGKEHHAYVRKLAVSPISIKEALLAPFRKIEETIQKMADKSAAESSAGMDKQLTSSAESGVGKVTSAPASTVAAGEKGAAAAPATPAAPAKEGGIGGQLPMLLAGGGLAIAALSAAAGYFIDIITSGAGALSAAIVGLPLVAALPDAAGGVITVLALPFSLIIILLGLLLIPFLIYAVPVSFATWLRLRRRDLATLLEGTGWAINTRMFITKETAGAFTKNPVVPPSSMRR